jgi:hypothetical protein
MDATMDAQIRRIRASMPTYWMDRGFIADLSMDAQV